MRRELLLTVINECAHSRDTQIPCYPVVDEREGQQPAMYSAVRSLQAPSREARTSTVTARARLSWRLRVLPVHSSKSYANSWTERTKGDRVFAPEPNCSGTVSIDGGKSRAYRYE